MPLAEVVDPDKFDKFEDFMAKVQAAWDLEWRSVFSAKFDGEPVAARRRLPTSASHRDT